eukprot:4497441-Alexandrium_andersonii.AAC.1
MPPSHPRARGVPCKAETSGTKPLGSGREVWPLFGHAPIQVRSPLQAGTRLHPDHLGSRIPVSCARAQILVWHSNAYM